LQQNFAEILLAALQNSDLLSKAAACSHKTRTIKFTPPLYDFVLSAQHFIAAKTMYFRSGAISSPYSVKTGAV